MVTVHRFGRNSPGEAPNNYLKPDELPEINPAKYALQGRCQRCRPRMIQPADKRRRYEAPAGDTGPFVCLGRDEPHGTTLDRDPEILAAVIVIGAVFPRAEAPQGLMLGAGGFSVSSNDNRSTVATIATDSASASSSSVGP